MKIILKIVSLLALILGLIRVINGKTRKNPVKKALVLIGASVIIYIVATYMPEQGIGKNGNAKRLGNTEYITNDMVLETSTDFSEGRAFVQFTDFSEEDLKMVEDGVKAALANDEDDAAKYAMKYIGYEPQGGNRAGLIDTQGRIIWKSERTLNGQALTAVSEFRDGLAYFIFSGNEGESYNIIDLDGNVSYTKECSEDFMILSHGGGVFLVAEHTVNFDVDEWQLGTIDKNGNIVAEYKPYAITKPAKEPLSVVEPPDASFELQDIDDALSRLAEERQEWVEKSWEYDGEMDEDYEATGLYALKTVVFDKFSVHDYQQLCEYLGENIFRVPLGNGFVTLNMDSQSVISVDVYSENAARIEQFITNFENGSATVLYNEPVDFESLEEEDDDIYVAMRPTNLYSLCRMETDGTITPIVSNSWTNYVLPLILNDENKFHDSLLFVPYSGDDDAVYMDKEYYSFTRDEETALKRGFTFHTGVYYSIDGEVALELSEYNGKREYFCDPFYDGYALMLIVGADQLTYFTVIDRSGELQFEPQSGFDDAYMSKDGKYLIAVKWHNLTVFDIMGNSLVSVISDQISSDDGFSARRDQINQIPLGNRYDVCDGVIRFRGFYINVKEKTIIGADYDTDVEFKQKDIRMIP